ncbi:UDP-N-acetylglucosamine 1-carboxyvinyltransferase [bacterium NHP-B]|nr:UDP-N-acetylglucosamine 1-carboxyvinyltransferase [bacterium NHP-B]
MDRLVISGGHALCGRVAIDGAKNALLPLMTASLLTTDPLHLHNAPPLADTFTMMRLLQHLGVDAHYHPNHKKIALCASVIQTEKAPYDIVRKMRASILVLGPLLARHGHAHVSLPGGCAIGLRPVNLHIDALQSLGALITLEDGYIHARAPQGGLRGGVYTFPSVSVTGTANLLMAATLARGGTTIHNAATEPEITDLATCLISMGATIEGLGTRTLTITGTSSLHGATHTVLPDRIETGTYILAATITGGDVYLDNTTLDLLPTFVSLLQSMGVVFDEQDNHVRVNSPPPGDMQGVNIQTAPYPGFPTDLQAQTMALLTLVNGQSQIQETIFENRLMHVAELLRMGAKLSVKNHIVHIEGREKLTHASLMATDLRASACLVLAALATQGESIIQRLYHLDRGYYNLEQKLAGCGADIRRVSGGPPAHKADTSHAL